MGDYVKNKYMFFIVISYGGKNMKNKIVGLFTCTLLITIMLIPIVGADSTINKKPITTNENGLIDNIYPINLHDSFLKDIIRNILALPRPDLAQGYIMLVLENHNNIDISLDWQLIIITKNGRVIYDDTSNDESLSAQSGLTYFFGLSRLDLLVNHYLVGPCSITFKLYVQQDGSEKTLAANGFFYNYGLKIL
jgi:hypothetical protein